MKRFAIDQFDFINLSRAFSRSTQRLVREIRPGVDGVTFWRTGQRSKPIVVTSVVDVADLDAAISLLAAYELLVGGDPVDVVWADDPLSGSQVVVLDVEPLDEGLYAIVQGIGGTQGTSGAMLRAQWTLEQIDVATIHELSGGLP